MFLMTFRRVESLREHDDVSVSDSDPATARSVFLVTPKDSCHIDKW